MPDQLNALNIFNGSLLRTFEIIILLHSSALSLLGLKPKSNHHHKACGTLSPDIIPAQNLQDFSPNITPARMPSGLSPDITPARMPSGHSSNITPARMPSGLSSDITPARMPSGFSPDITPL
ncbi:Saposin-like protein 11 [Gossypium arboreum]|uniref:Saposin-like protein 11 n=1 Tax=Gossypium arboreum TaxID=29729 RepID=A0A0B0MJY0_GOSAR|nr:Saposin-like protein 11 [Gossypium arboreum]